MSSIPIDPKLECSTTTSYQTSDTPEESHWVRALLLSEASFFRFNFRSSRFWNRRLSLCDSDVNQKYRPHFDLIQSRTLGWKSKRQNIRATFIWYFCSITIKITLFVLTSDLVLKISDNTDETQTFSFQISFQESSFWILILHINAITTENSI